MKSFSKILLLTAVAVMAIAVSAAPSEAAKKKAPKAVSACANVGAWCTMGGSNVQHYCGVNLKWTPLVLPACTWAGCPPPCN